MNFRRMPKCEKCGKSLISCICREETEPIKPSEAIQQQETVSSPPLTDTPKSFGGRRTKPMSIFRVYSENHQGVGTVSEPFESPTTAREHVRSLLMKAPDQYAEVSVYECYYTYYNTKQYQEPLFTETGPEFLRTDQPQLEHKPTNGTAKHSTTESTSTKPKKPA